MSIGQHKADKPSTAPELLTEASDVLMRCALVIGVLIVLELGGILVFLGSLR
jgi:hypothetical protein